MRSLRSLIVSESRRSQVARFIVTGGTGAFIEFLTLGFLVEVLEINRATAGTVSLVPSVIYVFLMNKYFTFRNRERKHGSQLLKFALVYGLAIVFNIALYNVLIWLGMLYPIAKAFAIGIVAFWNYLLSHGFIFRRVAVEAEEVVVV